MSTVAKTILEQLGGRRFAMMTGAKNFTSDGNTLSFQLPKAKNGIKVVKVTLNSSDTYTMTFLKVKRAPSHEVSVVATFSDVYNDSLTAVFEKTTGLYTSF